MKLGQVEQVLGASADVRDGMMSLLGTFAQQKHEERITHGTFRAFLPAMWRDTERDIKKLNIVVTCVSSI